MMTRLNRRGGFTLMELVLSVLILGVLTLVAAPVIARAFGGIGAKSEAQKLCEDIRYVQHTALTEGRSVTLVLDTDTRQYRVYPLDDTTDIRRDVTLDECVEGISSTFPMSGTVTYINYLPTGSPSQAGTVTLSHSGGGTVSVIVALGTGRVRVE